MAHTCAQRPLMAACLSQPRSAAAAACMQAVASGIDLWVPSPSHLRCSPGLLHPPTPGLAQRALLRSLLRPPQSECHLPVTLSVCPASFFFIALVIF